MYDNCSDAFSSAQRDKRFRWTHDFSNDVTNRNGDWIESFMIEVILSWTEVTINVDKEEELLYLLDAGQGQRDSERVV